MEHINKSEASGSMITEGENGENSSKRKADDTALLSPLKRTKTSGERMLIEDPLDGLVVEDPLDLLEKEPQDLLEEEPQDLFEEEFYTNVKKELEIKVEPEEAYAEQLPDISGEYSRGIPINAEAATVSNPLPIVTSAKQDTQKSMASGSRNTGGQGKYLRRKLDDLIPISDEELLLLSACTVAICMRRKITRNPLNQGCSEVELSSKGRRRKKRFWMDNLLSRREQVTHTDILNELRMKPPEWYSQLRVDEQTYLHLLSLITPLIKRNDTVMRKAITPHERLSVTLMYLATGRSYEDLKMLMGISAQAIGNIIPETCRAIWDTLQKDYMKFPNNEEEWTKIADEYYEKWKFPNCLGAVNGKHVIITPPNGTTSIKGAQSLILMAIVNARYEFMMCDFGTSGCKSGSEAMEKSVFHSRLSSNSLKIPPDRIPNDSTKELPFVFVGDEAFPLSKHFMTPFSQEELAHNRLDFNDKLSKVCDVANKTFNILSKRFKIFQKPLQVSFKKIDSVVMACCVLHNYLCKTSGNAYTTINSDACDEQTTLNETGFIDLEQGDDGQPNEEAKNVREMFQLYFREDRNAKKDVPSQE